MTQTNTSLSPQDLRNDLWLLLSLAVSSKEFLALEDKQKTDIVNTVKLLIDSHPNP